MSKTNNPANPANNGARPSNWLPELLVQNFYVTIPAGTQHLRVSFQTPDGYEFVSVLNEQTVGAVLPTLLDAENQTESGCIVWLMQTYSTSVKVCVTVLYMKNS
jgi:hypothetical protein